MCFYVTDHCIELNASFVLSVEFIAHEPGLSTCKRIHRISKLKQEDAFRENSRLHEALCMSTAVMGNVRKMRTARFN